METTAVDYTVWDATLSQGEYDYTFRWGPAVPRATRMHTLACIPALCHAQQGCCSKVPAAPAAQGREGLARASWAGRASCCLPAALAIAPPRCAQAAPAAPLPLVQICARPAG